MNLEKEVLDFLNIYNPAHRPLLLALSGGGDSMALFDLLTASTYPFHVAHVDHSWREESGAEAGYLAKLCREKEIPFHLKRLEVQKEENNLEDRARKARFAFFQEVCQRESLEAVVLAHHADDQAETVLKRVFEGATLPKLRGLSARTEMDGLVLLRPLLKVRKQTLLSRLDQKGVSYFEDSTNLDPRFLRTRLRQTVLPSLSQHFGKEVASSLCRIGKAAAELGDFLETMIAPYRKRIQYSENEVRLNFLPHPPQTPYLWKTVIRDFFETQNLTISNSIIETLYFHLQKKGPSIEIHVGKRRCIIEKKNLKLLCENK